MVSAHGNYNLSKIVEVSLFNNQKYSKVYLYINFDLFAMSQPIASDFINSDGVHFKPIWYSTVVNNIFNIMI